jgi:hypothetical protein
VVFVLLLVRQEAGSMVMGAEGFEAVVLQIKI